MILIRAGFRRHAHHRAAAAPVLRAVGILHHRHLRDRVRTQRQRDASIVEAGVRYSVGLKLHRPHRPARNGESRPRRRQPRRNGRLLHARVTLHARQQRQNLDRALVRHRQLVDLLQVETVLLSLISRSGSSAHPPKCITSDDVLPTVMSKSRFSMLPLSTVIGPRATFLKPAFSSVTR